MDIGIGLDFTLGLSYDEQATVSAEAARAGYTSIWTPENVGEDSFLLCMMRWQATREAVAGGIGTGIGVSPVGMRSPMGFAMSAGTMSKATGGKFTLGIGTGQAFNPKYRNTWNMRGKSTLGLMRDYLTIIRGLVNGEAVDYTGASAELHGAKLAINPAPKTPVFLAALGPEMCKLAGEAADGVSLNWCSGDAVDWSRQLVREGAEKAGRDPSGVKIAEYIRVCVDDDVDQARRAFARNMMGYALGPLDVKPQSYRAHFERMGWTEDLKRIDNLRRKQAPVEEVIDAFPPEMLLSVGYFGKAAGAKAHFTKLADGLDTAIVRVIAARPGADSTRAVLQACAPK